jgi:hypothetical protein
MEYLKCALLNLYWSKAPHGFFERFNTEGNELFAKHGNVVLKGCDDQIDVFFENPSENSRRRWEYLTPENTFKRFQSPPAALEYLHYLIRATNDVRFEMYHYFIFKLQEIGMEYKYWSFDYTYYYGKVDLEHLIVNTGVGDLKKKGLELNFSIQIELFKNNTCQLIFVSPEPLWNEAKICPETQLHKVLDYVQNLNVCEYDEIPIEETSVI